MTFPRPWVGMQNERTALVFNVPTATGWVAAGTVNVFIAQTYARETTGPGSANGNATCRR